MFFKPHQYQKDAIRFLYEKPYSGIFADPGLGKTAIALALIQKIKHNNPKLKTLLVSPLTVCFNTWQDEIAKWDQFNSISYGILHDHWQSPFAWTDDKLETLCDKDLDLYITNPENLKWLFSVLSHWYKRFPFHTLLIDESTRFKNMKAKRYSIIRKFLDRFQRRHIMTGTPIPNSLLDIFPQMYLVDKGFCLGKHIVPFRERYFKKTGYKGYQWKALEDSQKKIEKKIAPAIIRIDAEDHIDMPEFIENPVYVGLPDEIQEIYESIEKAFFAEIEDEEIIIPTESAKYNVCRQIASGGLYKPSEFFDIPRNRKTFYLHTAKAEALENIQNELNGKPVLVGYHYRFVIPHLKTYFKAPRLPYIASGIKQGTITQLIKKWNSDRLPLLLGQPQSVGHGLNLQKSSCKDIVWFGVPDNFESYDQFNRRVRRQGSKQKKITAHILIAKNTIETVIWKRLQTKDMNQKALLDALKRYGQKKGY